MILSEGLEQSFWQDLKTFEEERKVTYVTTGERIGYAQGEREGRQEGHQEGRQQGRQEEAQALILRQLTRRIGDVTPEERSQIQFLPLPQLEALGESLLDFSTPDDLKHWLQAHA
jgi:predicted transposase YdaD